MEGSTETIGSPVSDSDESITTGPKDNAATRAIDSKGVRATNDNPSEVELDQDSARAYADTPRPDFDKQPEVHPREKIDVNIRTLLEAGVHFGHQTSRWNPQMAPYIHSNRNGVHIVNLPKTISAWEKARAAILEVTSRGGNVLFVGTKKQAQDAIVEEATRSGSFYVSRRWLGGMLTNFQTIRKSIERMNKLETILLEEDDSLRVGMGSKFTKKERLMMSRDRDKLYYSLGGIRNMYGPPQLMFVVDVKREDIAVNEARRLDIPVVALVDTNCSPKNVDYVIPSNDDGTRAIRFFASAIADAVMEGKEVYKERVQIAKKEQAAEQKKEKEAKAAKEKGDSSLETDSAGGAPSGASES